MQQEHTYIAIDLKSFYASVECTDKGLDPLTTNLVVADASRTQKTICLAVSPSMKAYGIPGRPRLFEVVQRMKEVNRERSRRISFSGDSVRKNADTGQETPGDSLFSGSSFSAPELEADPTLKADYIIAVPRMAHYIEYSTRIYQIYLRYIAPEDIHVYSIDEVMMDVTKYLVLYKKTAHELAMEMIRAVLKETGITATAGIGPNLYLCKIAMDIEAKHTAPDADGVRIAELDEMSYRRKLWGHRPITDFWRVGKGTAKKLARYGMFTMGDVARYSLKDEDLLYKLFGVNAELLIDHAWGWEPCTIDYIKAYKPENRSFSAGQVLQCPYDFEKARIVVLEMADAAALDLVEKRLTADQMVLTVVYDKDNLTDPAIREKYKGPVKKDWYGRMAPKPAHGTVSLGRHTSSSRIITDAVLSLYDRIVDPDLLVRRIFLVTNHVIEEAGTKGSVSKDSVFSASLETGILSGTDRSRNLGRKQESPRQTEETEREGGSAAAGSWQQLDLFTDYEVLEAEKEREKAALEKERRLQEAMLEIRRKYGKNAILKGTSLQEGATMRDRNQSIGGHKA
ncbi:MAG: DNA methylase [Lachnospiraceae bacterium]|nr:DNA methylase [Lachnospiraceae bacterium]